jgi:hypothetical protein
VTPLATGVAPGSNEVQPFTYVPHVSDDSIILSLHVHMSYFSALEVIKVRREKQITPNIVGQPQAGLFGWGMMWTEGNKVFQGW